MIQVPRATASVRRPLATDETLCFVHIPKTAGLSLRPLLDNRFQLDQICPADMNTSLAAIDSEALRQYRLLRGHFWANVHERLPLTTVYMTMLRDPIERTLSQYHYVRRDRSNAPLFEMVTGMSLEQYLYDEFICEETLRDLQTRYLAPSGQPAAGIESAPPGHLGIEYAKATLRSCAFVGLTERFDDSLRLLAHTFHWRPIAQFEHRNATAARTQRQDLAPHLLARIRELNQNDIELYEYGVRLFESRFAEMTEELLWEAYDQRRLIVQPHADRVRFEAGDPWEGEGWHPPEFDGKGYPYRWMAYSRAYLDVAMTRTTDKLLRMRLMNFVALDVYHTLQVSANGVNIPLTSADVNGEVVVSGVIPRETPARANGSTRIEFSISETRQPTPVADEPADRRQLGLAFGWLEIGPAAG